VRKTAICLVAAAGALAMGCQGKLAPQNADSSLDSMINDITEQASEELKKAFAAEIGNFFENNDLAVTLGISSDEQEQLESSIKSYIDSYYMDEEKLDNAKESVEELLENAKGLSMEELQDGLKNIFE